MSKTGVPPFNPDPIISAFIVGTATRVLAGLFLKLNLSDGFIPSSRVFEASGEKNSLSIIFPSFFLFFALNLDSSY